MKDSYHLTKLFKLVTAEVAIFNEKRNELIKEFGAESANGDCEVVGDDAKRAYFAKVQELLAVPVEIAWAPVTKAQLDAIDGLRVSGADLVDLGPLFED
jgi:hypothetical protein